MIGEYGNTHPRNTPETDILSPEYEVTLNVVTLLHCRLFKKAELEELLRQIEESGRYPTGWKRPLGRKSKPR